MYYLVKVIIVFTKEKLIKLINDADAVVIGAGAGLSSAAGFEYGGKTFMDNFKYMYDFIKYIKFKYTTLNICTIVFSKYFINE